MKVQEWDIINKNILFIYIQINKIYFKYLF